MGEIAPAAEFGVLLVGVGRLVRRRLRRDLVGPPLRGGQVELLRLVRETPATRVSDAARELGLAGNSVSTLVRELTGLGLLERAADPRDRRAVLLSVTPEASRRLAEWDDRRAALFTREFTRLAGSERAALIAALPALRALAANLREEAAPPGREEALPS
ncbi:MarR family transcriptional regulator [Streptomyces sp. NPDC000594]|uniref:MarR family winged helix-turn-helix transcriptional regulator n=1 Tax=Streptomyces sp. NPDC000594 TaxID=3154261 RepID=UPI00331A7EB4